MSEPTYWNPVVAAWVLLAAVPLAIVILKIEDRRKAKRLKELEAAVSLLGLIFEPLDKGGSQSRPPSLPPPIWDFNVMKQSSAATIQWMANGKYRNTPVWLFDYSFGTGEASETSMEWTVTAWKTWTNVPEFELRGTELRNMIKEHREFQWADHKIFFKNYWLRGPDEQTLRSYFTDPMIQYFEGHPGWGIESRDGCMLVYQSGLAEPAKLPGLVEEMHSVYQLMVK